MAHRALIGVVLTGLAIGGPIDVTHAGVPGVIAESARTAAHSVRDGVLTFARTTRAFFTGGASEAEDTWYDNVESMRERARQNADRVRDEARMVDRRYEPREQYRDDDYDHEYRDEPAPPDDWDRRDEPLPPSDY